MKLIPKKNAFAVKRGRFAFIPGSYSITFAECFVLNNDRTFFCIECCLFLNVGIETLAAQDNHSSFTFWLSRQFPLVKFLVKAFYFNREITVQSYTALSICALIFTGCGSLKCRIGYNSLFCLSWCRCWCFFSEHAVKAIRPIANARIDNFFIIFKFYMLIIMLI